MLNDYEIINMKSICRSVLVLLLLTCVGTSCTGEGEDVVPALSDDSDAAADTSSVTDTSSDLIIADSNTSNDSDSFDSETLHHSDSDSTSGSLDSEGDSDTSSEKDSQCISAGSVSYTLTKAESASSDEQEAYALIEAAMDQAVFYYNCYTDLSKELHVQYAPDDVDTADGSINGSIRFGARYTMQVATAMHEIAHTLGIGTSWEYQSLIVEGVYQGESATALLREVESDSQAEIHGDGAHFWPFGLNYESEYQNETDLINHCGMVRAIIHDMGWI